MKHDGLKKLKQNREYQVLMSVEKLEPLRIAVQLLGKTVCQFFKMLIIELLNDSVTQLLGI